MNRNRKIIVTAVLTLGVVFAFGGYQLFRFQRAFGVQDHRVVQILKSTAGRFKAELIRRHALFDLNFIIQLNGEQIYYSRDFKPNYTIPFRETILWDKTGENLILEVGEERLFGYSMTAKRKLSDKEFLSLEVQELKLGDF